MTALEFPALLRDSMGFVPAIPSLPRGVRLVRRRTEQGGKPWGLLRLLDTGADKKVVPQACGSRRRLSRAPSDHCR